MIIHACVCVWVCIMRSHLIQKTINTTSDARAETNHMIHSMSGLIQNQYNHHIMFNSTTRNECTLCDKYKCMLRHIKSSMRCMPAGWAIGAVRWGVWLVRCACLKLLMHQKQTIPCANLTLFRVWVLCQCWNSLIRSFVNWMRTGNSIRKYYE